MKWKLKEMALACALWLSPAHAGAESAQALERVVDAQIATDEAARASQERINTLDDETQKMLSEYRRAVADTESYSTYARQLAAQVESQEIEMAGMEQQLVEVETTSREVAPLMERMLSTLEQFVALDVPFLLDERRERVAKLKEMMDRADVTLSEKFRRIVETYQIEMDYGRTVEAYEAKLGEDADTRTVQLLRIGRVGLLYQTLDGVETGYWDAREKRWVADNDYAHGFKEGMAVARKTRAPEMLILPVPAPKQAQS